MLQSQIAGRLDIAFSRWGFAQASIGQLKDACDVSLRTLYRYYPSKESMIVAALNHRHQRYLCYINENLSDCAQRNVHIVFDRLGQWMANEAPNGCMSTNALAAFPDNVQIKQAVMQHKQETRQFFINLGLSDDLAKALFLLHEGISNTWPMWGQHALDSAKMLVDLLFNKERHV